MCTGPGSQSDGATAELSPGTSQWHCPLRMINEPADSSNAASCSGAVPGLGEALFSPTPGSYPRGTHLPQCQTGGWHPPTPGRNRQERWHRAGRCSLASRILRPQEPWKGCLFLSLSWARFHLGISRPWPWEMRSSAHAPWAGTFLFGLNLTKHKHLPHCPPGDPTSDTSVVWKEADVQEQQGVWARALGVPEGADGSKS